MKGCRKILSALLAMCLVLTLMPFSALADEGIPARSSIDNTIKGKTNVPVSDLNAEEASGKSKADVVRAAMSGSCGPSVNWTLTNNGTLTISGTGEMYNWSSEFGKTCPWNGSIGDNIKKVVIKNGVTSIGAYAFYDCNANTISIDIPSSVITIGDGAFSGCSLTDIIIPNGVNTIGNGAFTFANISSITIPPSVTNFSGAFWGCDALKNVTISNGISSIDDYAFDGCFNLTNVTIPDSVTNIGSNAFRQCKLKSITLPEKLTSIGESSFYDCVWLSDVYYSGTKAQWQAIAIANNNAPLLASTIHCKDDNIDPGSDVVASGECGAEGYDLTWSLDNTGTLTISGIGEMRGYADAWDYDPTPWRDYSSRLNRIVVENGVTRIGREALWSISCPKVESVSIGDSLEEIGYYSFVGLGISSIAFPQALKKIEKSAFYACDKLSDIYYSGTKAQWKAIAVGENNDPLTTATIHCTDGDINGSDPGPSGTASITRLSPANGSTFNHADKTADTRLRIFFDREVSNAGGNRPELDFSVGTLEVHKAGDQSVVYQVKSGTDVSLWNVEGKPTAIVLNGVTTALDYGTEYYVTMPAGFIKFADGAVSPAIQKGNWTFATIAEAPCVAPISKSGMFRFMSDIIDGDDMVYSYNYDETWFLEDSTEY